MSTPIRPTTTITIDSKEHTLRYTHRDFSVAQYRMEQQGWGVIVLLGPKAKDFWTKLGQIEEVIIDDKPLEALAPDHFSLGVLLYVGLLHADKKLTLDDTLELITFDNVAGLQVPLYQAAVEGMTGLTIEEAAKRAQGKEAKKGPPLPLGNGGASDGASPAKILDSEPDPSPETITTSSGTSPQPSSMPSGDGT